MTDFTLSPDQQQALSRIEDSLTQGAPEVVLVGAAGTGKTTVLRELLARLERPVIWAAPTGKAASRLRESTGEQATTLHGLLYRRVDENFKLPKQYEPKFAAYVAACDAGEALPDGLRKGLDPYDWLCWYLWQQGRTPDSDLHFGDVALSPLYVGMQDAVVVVDEASMVGTQLASDLRMMTQSRGWPIIWVGDKAQLQPVKDSWGADLDKPTAELTQVHRQAGDSAILAAATIVREGGELPWQTVDDYIVDVGGTEGAARWYCERAAAGADCTVLTFTNKDRTRINQTVRRRLGYEAQAPIVKGERLVMLRNRGSVCNGEVYTVLDVESKYNKWTDQYFTWVTIDKAGLGGKHVRFIVDTQKLITGVAAPNMPRETMPVDYGYCLSVHKSQGSQWDEVCLAYTWSWLRRRRPEDYARLTYTAITRAARKLWVLSA